MTWSINIQYQNATFTANNATIAVGGGGTFALGSNEFLSMSGSFPFDTLNVSSGAINFYNNASGAAVNGEVTIPVNAANGDPTITVNNFSGSVTLMWPTNSGPQYQSLSSGDPVTLVGFPG